MDEFAPVCKFTYMQNKLHMCKFGHENGALDAQNKVTYVNINKVRYVNINKVTYVNINKVTYVNINKVTYVHINSILWRVICSH